MDAPALKDFEELTRQHIDSLWRLAFRMTGCPDLASDLTQETCLKAFRSLDQYQAGTNYRAWIFRILVNLCTDQQRREARAPFKEWDNNEVDAALSKNTDKRDLPDIQLERSVFYTQALEAMSRLRPDVRIVVCLSLLDGMTYQEIADMTNVPIGTVRSRLSRGRKRLQSDLKIHAVLSDHCPRKACGNTAHDSSRNINLNLVAESTKQKI